MKVSHYVRGFFRRKWYRAPSPLYFLPDQDDVADSDYVGAFNEIITSVKPSFVQRSITSIVSLFGRKKNVRRKQTAKLYEETDREEQNSGSEPVILKRNLEQQDAAIIIQCMFRTRAALSVRNSKLQAAFQEAQIFWTEERRVKAELKVAKQARGQVVEIF